MKPTGWVSDHLPSGTASGVDPGSGAVGAPARAIAVTPEDMVFPLHPTSVHRRTVQPFGPYPDHRGE